MDKITRATICDCHWKNIEIWIRTKHLVICGVYFCFSKYTKEEFNVQRAYYSPNTLPTMAHSQVFCIVTWQPPIETTPDNLPRRRHLLSTTWDRTRQQCRVSLGHRIQYTVLQANQVLFSRHPRNWHRLHLHGAKCKWQRALNPEGRKHGYSAF